MTLNVERLIDELVFLTEFPEKWDQTLWLQTTNPNRVSACGTTGCLAGNTVLHQNYKLYWEEAGVVTDLEGKKTMLYTADYTEEIDDGDGGTYQGKPIDEVAMFELDLTETQANSLFDGDNTLDELWEKAEQITQQSLDHHRELAEERREERLRIEAIAAKVNKSE